MNYLFRVSALGILACSILVGAAKPSGFAQTMESHSVTAAEQSLLDAETARFQAQLAGDVTALTRDIAEDAEYTHNSGTVQNKEQYLHGFEPGKVRYRSIEPTEREAKVYGDIGVTHGKLAQDAGAGKPSVSRYTGVYIKRDGRWQLLSWQTTQIASSQ